MYLRTLPVNAHLHLEQVLSPLQLVGQVPPRFLQPLDLPPQLLRVLLVNRARVQVQLLQEIHFSPGWVLPVIVQVLHHLPEKGWVEFLDFLLNVYERHGAGV